MRVPSVPNGWKVVKLRDLVRIVRGASPRPKGDPRFFGGCIPWVSIRDITSEKGRTLRTTREFVTEEGAARSRLLAAGTLVLTNSGTVCVPKFLSVAGCIHDGFVAFLDVPHTVSLNYLFEYFNWLRPTVVNKFRQGVTQVNLNTTIVGDFDVPLPALDEQERIAAAIDSHFSRLDAATATLERVQRNLDRYRASVLKAAVEGRLVPTEAELAKKEGRSYEPASVLLKRILAERRGRWEEAELAKLMAKGKPPTDDRWKVRYEEAVAPDTNGLPELPEGWCWTSVDALLREPLRNGHSARESKDGSGIRTLTLSAVTLGDFSAVNTKVTVAIPDKVADLWLLAGDILVERSNTPELVGLSAHFRGPDQFAIFPDLMIRVRTTPLVDVEFIAALLRENRVRSCWRHQAQGIAGTMPKISQDVIAKTMLPLPPLREQQRIISELSARLSSADSATKVVALSETRVRRLRQSILNWAFEGRLVDQDPSAAPEPATMNPATLRRSASTEPSARR